MVEPNNLKKASQLPFLNVLKVSSSRENVAIKIATKNQHTMMMMMMMRGHQNNTKILKFWI